MVPEINLLPKIESKKSSNFLIILCVILLGALILFLIMQSFSLKKDISALTNEEIQLAAEQEVLVAQVSSTNTEDQGSLSSSVTFVESVSYPVSPLIEEVQSLLIENTYLRDYQFAEMGVNLTADFETMNGLSIFIEKLLNSSYFTDVKVEQISTFEPAVNSEETTDTDETDFDAQPRYSATINLTIDQVYLSAGGARP